MSARMEDALVPRVRLRPADAEALHVTNHRLLEGRRITLGALHGIRDALAGGKPALAADLARYAIEAVTDTSRGNAALAQLDRELADALGEAEDLRGKLTEAEATIERQRTLLLRAQAALAGRRPAA